MIYKNTYWIHVHIETHHMVYVMTAYFSTGALENVLNDPVVYENYAAHFKNKKSSFETLKICHEFII